MRAPKYKGVYPRVLNTLDTPTVSATARVVTIDLYAEALTRNPACKCSEEHGVLVGRTLRGLRILEGGCTGVGEGRTYITDPETGKHTRISGAHVYVCPALDYMRRVLGSSS